MEHQPLRDMAIAVEVNSQSEGAGSVNGTGVDMLGWDRVAFVANAGIIGNGGTFDLRAVESANANFSGAVNIANAAITQLPNTTANVPLVLDLQRPVSGNRYVRVVATAGTNSVNVGVLSFKYRGTGRLPQALGTNAQYVIA